MATKLLYAWKRRVNELKMETYTLYLAYKDPRVLWYAKILIVCVIGYAFSPIHKLLNSIPMIGYLDHLVLAPPGFVLAFKKMIPSEVLTDCRRKARMVSPRKLNWAAGSIIIVIWFLFASLTTAFTMWIMKDRNLVLRQWFGWFTRTTLISESHAH